MPTDLHHVADLATIQRDRNGEIRVSLLEGPDGCAVEIRKFQRSRHSGGLIASGPGLMVFSDRIPELMAALDRGHRAAVALREASR